MIAQVLCVATMVAGPVPPRAQRSPVELRFHGVKVTDDYVWLENDSDPRVKEWSEAQNAVAREFLGRVPNREALHKRIDKLVRSGSDSFSQIVDRRAHGHLRVLFRCAGDPVLSGDQLPLTLTMSRELIRADL